MAITKRSNKCDTRHTGSYQDNRTQKKQNLLHKTQKYEYEKYQLTKQTYYIMRLINPKKEKAYPGQRQQRDQCKMKNRKVQGTTCKKSNEIDNSPK